LIHRQAGDSWSNEERQIRAVVLKLPSGAVEAETVWPAHDRSVPVDAEGWTLPGARRDNLLEGAHRRTQTDSAFPDRCFPVSMDPTQQFMVTNSREPAARRP